MAARDYRLVRGAGTFPAGLTGPPLSDGVTDLTFKAKRFGEDDKGSARF